MDKFFTFLLGAAVGAIAVLAVQKALDQDSESFNELGDSIERQLERLEKETSVSSN